MASGAAIGQSHGPMTEADPSGLFNPDSSQKIYSLPLLNDYHTLSTSKHLNGSVHHRTVCFQKIRKKKQRLKLSLNPDQEWN